MLFCCPCQLLINCAACSLRIVSATLGMDHEKPLSLSLGTPNLRAARTTVNVIADGLAIEPL
jgi:hypothetical protein